MRNEAKINSTINVMGYLDYRGKECFFLTLLVFISIISIKAQTLRIGDPAPVLNPYEWVKGDPISKFKKGTPYVVEFGATWCTPCKAVIPELTELAKKYGGRAEVIGIFVQEINYDRTSKEPKYIKNVREYVKKRGDGMAYHVAVDGPEKTIERSWIDAMGKGRGVPQTFVVDKQGRIAGHFNGASITAVEAFLKTVIDGTYNLENELKKEQKANAERTVYDRYKPLFVDGNGGDEKDFLFRSMLTRAKGDIKGKPSLFIDSYQWAEKQKFQNLQGRVQQVNISLPELYQLAYSDTLYNAPEYREPFTNQYADTVRFPRMKRSYGRYWPEPILEVSDAAPFQYKSGYRYPKNKWNYVLNVPKERATAAFLQRAMQRDLAIYFGYDVTVETREMPCWFLKAGTEALKRLQTKTPGEPYKRDKVKNKDGSVYYAFTNADIRDLIGYLDYLYRKAIKKMEGIAPFIDRTGIVGEIDYKIPEKAWNLLSNGDFEGFRDFLPSLGLHLEKGTKSMKVVVIRDPKKDL